MVEWRAVREVERQEADNRSNRRDHDGCEVEPCRRDDRFALIQAFAHFGTNARDQVNGISNSDGEDARRR